MKTVSGEWTAFSKDRRTISALDNYRVVRRCVFIQGSLGMNIIRSVAKSEIRKRGAENVVIISWNHHLTHSCFFWRPPFTILLPTARWSCFCFGSGFVMSNLSNHPSPSLNPPSSSSSSRSQRHRSSQKGADDETGPSYRLGTVRVSWDLLLTFSLHLVCLCLDHCPCLSFVSSLRLLIF